MWQLCYTLYDEGPWFELDMVGEQTEVRGKRKMKRRHIPPPPGSERKKKQRGGI